jgi:hypothetical protein
LSNTLEELLVYIVVDIFVPFMPHPLMLRYFVPLARLKRPNQIEKLISIPPRGRLTLQCLVSLVESNLDSSQHYVLFKPHEEVTLFIEPFETKKM